MKRFMFPCKKKKKKKNINKFLKFCL